MTNHRQRDIASLLYALLLRLLPSRLRARLAAEMLETFRERQREARAAGYGERVRVWASEFSGLLGMVILARRRDDWEARLDRELAPGHAAGRFDRRVRKASLIGNLEQDLHFAGRAWARRPGVSVLAVATIALGVGASSAMFSVVDTVLLRPLPYRDPGRLVMVYPTIPEWRGHPSLDASWERGAFSYPEFVEWSRSQRSFEEAAAYTRRTATILDGDGVPERVQIGLATRGLFPMLGVEAAVGRTFAADDDPATSAVLLSHGFWQRRFGGDGSVVGRTVRLNDAAHTIVGVLPRDFVFPTQESDLWQVIGGPPDEREREDHTLTVIARLRDGVTPGSAQAETDRLLRAMTAPDHFIQHGARVWPHLDEVTRGVRAPLWILVGASWLLLLIACVNVGTLLLGAGIDRETELAVRAAIGAGRRRIMSQLLTESLALAAVGGAGGVLLARAGTRLLTLLAPAGIPRIEQVALDGRIVAFAVAITALCGVLFGLVPTLSLSRTAPGRALYAARSGGQRQRLHAGLVVAEMALATVLLAGAGLLTRNMAALNAVDPGFDAENLLTVRVALPYARFASEGEEPAQVDRVIRDWLERILVELRSLPGVEAVALTSSLPYSGDRASNLIEPEGYVPAAGEVLLAERRRVSWNYLDVMRMRLVEGRMLVAADDHPGADPVAMVSENLARRFWPAESAVGKHLGAWNERLRIVGVVAESREIDLAGDPDGGFGKYYATGQLARSGFGHIVIRTTGEPSSLAHTVRQRIWSVDDELPITNVMPMTERVRDSLAEQRYRMRLMVTFAALAGGFALLGVHGVISRSVARRTHEMGIRMALGSPRRRVLSLVVGEGMRLVAVGAGIGLIVSFLATRILERFLYAAGRNDSLVLTAVVLGIGLLGLIASLGPAGRAVRVSPMIALRADRR